MQARALPLPVAALLLLVAAAVLLPGLRSLPLVDPDEGRHAEIARELCEAPGWRDRILPRLEDAPYRDKPILFYWVTGGLFAVLGIDTAVARLPSVAAAIVTLSAMAAAGARAFGPRAGLLGGLVLLSSPAFALLGRAATLDMLFTCWITLAMLASWRWTTTGSTRALVAAAGAAGVGALTKGLAAPALVGATTLLGLALDGRLRSLRLRDAAGAVAVFAAVVAPWLIAAWWTDPAYVRELLVVHHVQRFLGTGGNRLHPGSGVLYVPVLLGGFFPWSLLLPATTVVAWSQPGGRDAIRFLATWALVVLGFFVASRGWRAPYLLPAFPPLALLTGLALDRWLAGEVRGRTLARHGLVAAGAVAVATPAAVIPFAARAYDGALLGLAWWSLLLVPVGVATAALATRGRLAAAAAVVGSALVLAAAGLPALAGSTIGELTGTAHVVALVRRAGPRTPVAVYGLALPSIRFQLGRPVTAIDRPRALAAFVASHPDAVVVTTPRHLATVTAAVPLEVWLRGPRRVLLGAGPPPDVGHAEPPGL